MRIQRTVVGLFLVLMVFSLFTEGCAKKKKGVLSEQLGTGLEGSDMQMAALKGEDIALNQQPDMGSFVEPNDPLVFADVHFDYNKSEIKPEARPTLEKISKWLSAHGGIQLMVEGHCDERGSNEYNLALGEQRALSVRRYIVGLGTNADRLHTVSYGEERPLDPGHGESSWSKNRRGHFLVSAE